MYIGVKKVKPLQNYELLITFENEEEKIFDLKPYLNTGLFADLKNESLFKTVRVVLDSLEWNNGVDICPEVLYSESRNI
ncbi:MAG: DUF2442 domain-containing protein [Candidatus Riflebacteria bacterium]|nr:DUF2442 domain-containing protein [Candidatus Riflebacteria bacterium]